MSSERNDLGQYVAASLGEQRLQRILELYAKDPGTLDGILYDEVEKEPVLDYITELETRKVLFADFRELARRHGYSLNAVALGIMLVAPVERMRSILEDIKNTPEGVRGVTACGILDRLCGPVSVRGIRAFVVKGGPPLSASTTPKKRNASETTSPQTTPTKRQRISHSKSNSDSNIPQMPAGSPTTLSPVPGAAAFFQSPGLLDSRSGRSVEAKNLAKERDDWRCVLTDVSDPEAAHIFPHSTAEKKSFADINSILSMFWGLERAEAWSRLFETRDVTESTRNFICLNRNLHWWFDNARMGLKPLRMTEDNGVLVQFHWLKSNKLKPQATLENPLQALPFADILSKAGLSDNRVWGGCLAHRRSGLPLETGQTFVLGAKMPERAPSFELLQLSWDLLRVAAICGAAQAVELAGEDGDDDLEPGCLIGEGDEQDQWGRWAEDLQSGEEWEPESESESEAKHAR